MTPPTALLRWSRLAPITACMLVNLPADAAVAPPRPSATKTPLRVALVVGNNRPEPQSQVPNLRYADDDAVATHQLFMEAGIHSILLTRLDRDSQRLHGPRSAGIHPDGPPTWRAISAALERLHNEIRRANRSRRRTELLLFFSGHGDVAHGEGYLVLEGSRLTRSMLYDKVLRRSPATVNHVIIDACKSYFLAASRGTGGERTPYNQSFHRPRTPSKLNNVGFVLSTSSAADSHEWEEYQAGVFSHEIRSGLRGAADVNRDGQITYGELGAFVTVANSGIVNPRYRPDVSVLPPHRPPGQLTVPLIRWPANGSALLLDSSNKPRGRLFVESTQGQRLLDVHPAAGQQLRLHLPPARPLFVRVAGTPTEYVMRSPSASLSSLQGQPLAVARKGAIHLAFRSLFAVPFGAVDVTAFAQAYRAQQDMALSQQYAADRHIGSVRSIVRRAAGWTAIVSAALAAGLHLWSWRDSEAASSAPQNERPAINDRVTALNAAAITAYALAGVAATTWLVSTLWNWEKSENDRVAVGPALTPTANGTTGVGLSLASAW